MVKISDIIGSLSRCLDAQRELEQCRRRASGDVEYYSYSFAQDLKQAEADLELTLNEYIDQRVAQKSDPLNTLKFEQLSPVARSAALAA